MVCEADWPGTACTRGTCVIDRGSGSGGAVAATSDEYSDPRSYCVCDDGWDGRADFIQFVGGATSDEPGSCNNHPTTITIGVALVGVMAVVTLLLLIGRMVQLCRTHGVFGGSGGASGGGERKSFGSLIQLALFRFVALAIVYDGLIIACAALRIFTHHRPGFSVPLSILFGFNDLVFWSMCAELIRVWTGLLFTLLKINNQLAADGARVYHRLNRWLILGSALGGLAGLWILLMPFSGRDAMMPLVVTHIVFHAGVVVVLTSCLYASLMAVEPLLMKAAETSAALSGGGSDGRSNDLSRALANIKTGRKFLIQQVLPPGLALDIVFASWPFLRSKVQYQVWFSLIQAQSIIVAFLWMTRVSGGGGTSGGASAREKHGPATVVPINTATATATTTAGQALTPGRGTNTVRSSFAGAAASPRQMRVATATTTVKIASTAVLPPPPLRPQISDPAASNNSGGGMTEPLLPVSPAAGATELSPVRIVMLNPAAAASPDVLPALVMPISPPGAATATTVSAPSQ